LDARVLTCAGFDGAIRWREGERLEQLFEERCDGLRQQGRGDHLAVDGPDASLSYAELDARANQLARFLVLRQGIRPGDRVGLLFDQAADTYVAMLAVLKVHAAYVPLDPAFPPGRLKYIVSDAGVRVVLSRSSLAEDLALADDTVVVVNLGDRQDQITRQSEDRLDENEIGDVVDELCYVIYTSGTTGRPKGVAVSHASVCNFVRVAAEVYGIVDNDRVYQGLTIAFDFSIEEIWIPWMAGATLVPKPSGGNLVGADLDAFLRERRVTALCCVPTLLATLDEDLPDLRFLLVSGESCPQDLVAAWCRPGRRFLNVYGPTEATVTATWAVMHPDRSVTIGVPLPTYSIVILDPDAERALRPGETGEIGIAGIGLANGYLNRPDLTERAFVPDFLGMPENPSGRIYRTGDVGRVNDGGEIELLGRIDTQVKIRGYRVELGEIESVLRQVPTIEQAVVATYQPEPDLIELVAYYRLRPDAGALDAGRVYEHLRERLPAYMVPAYLERLEVVPVTTCGKTDRQHLPPPSGSRRLTTQDDLVPPATETESALADQLARILGLERVSVESHFFDDLGADSLLMARFSAALRKGAGDFPTVSMRGIYLHPTVRRLAAALAEAGATSESEPLVVPPPTGTPRYVLCGALQLLTFLTYACLAALLLNAGAAWLAAGHGILSLYLRAVVFGGGVLLGVGLFPIVAKWALIGRWKRQRIRIWSLAYVRFWIVKTLVVANPTARLCVGTPLYGLYLRALGAKIGRGSVINTHHVPVCTDLLSVGRGSVIRKDTYLNGYRARSGVIEIGAITLGQNVFVGEQSVLDIDTTLEDGAQLGHSSSLHAGQVVDAGQCWHGSPARPADAVDDYRTVAPAPCGTLRRARYSIGLLVVLLATVGPLEAAVATLAFSHPALLAHLSGVDALAVSAILVFGLVLVGLVLSSTVPRLLGRALKPGTVYPLYGLHYSLHRIIVLTSNIRFLTALFGDSTAIVSYLRVLGYRLGTVLQTGTNFGMDVKQDIPTLCEIGTGTMVSDGLSIINAEFSSSSFRVMPVAIGARNFLGNTICYPAAGRTGDNCLLATKVMVPVGGPIRQGVGLLGSPSFEIPRSVQRDGQFDHLSTGAERQRRLAAKTRHNVATMALYLLVRYLYVSGLVLLALLAFGGEGWGRPAGVVATILLDVAFPFVFFVLVERAVTGFRALQPRFCSIYQVEFWRHERFWKVPATAYLQLFNGTPFKGAAWRLLGVDMGRRVFDDGCAIVERTLVSVGNDSTLNMGSELQCHSLEDGTFKSDRIRVGAGCTVGTGAWVCYGVTMDDGSVLEADSFLMKGSHLSAGARWRGNPASEIPSPPVADGAGRRSTSTPQRPPLRSGQPLRSASLAES
jgi:non-ribosomal peptide synthetase-like protein